MKKFSRKSIEMQVEYVYHSDAVPDEVREWLAATFTRQTVQTRRYKPKFKSVANAIRTGIFFEK